MEFDLLCKHLDRINEIALVECKIKDKLSSDEITKFVFNVGYKKYNYGFFLYTKKYGHQVAGLIEELKNDREKRYENIYFWDAEKVIELLIASNQIKLFEYKNKDFNVTKTILFYSYFGTFYISILSNSTIPTHFLILNAINLNIIDNEDVIQKIKALIPEIQSLRYYKQYNEIKQDNNVIIETVVEIQESESWYDHKPASIKYFVGRNKIETAIFEYFESIYNNTTNSRIFYIKGKSGWGKSSLLNAIKGRTRNKHYKNKYFTYVVDSRSANSQNFIALAFNKMLEKASKDGFIDKQYKEIQIGSIYNILDSQKVEKLIKYLNVNKKILILIFDQFEDVFRIGNIFQGFYKLLIDVIDKCTNIIIGFSWKSEINIPMEHSAYSLWQQSKNFAKEFTLTEFDYTECKKIVKQLEKAINKKFDNDFIRKIIDNSQGFPWLVKKLCVHIFDQYKHNVSLKNLYLQDFNVALLFKEDEEKLNPEEIKALKYIATRAYENDFLDEIEIHEIIRPQIRDSLLLNKKMIIKSGTKYNIYWDIFRDYLVTKKAPKIGETYILRYHALTVYELLSTFNVKNKMNIDEILHEINISIAKTTAGNLLRELRTLGLVIYEDEYYLLRENIFNITELNFINFLKEKLCNHSFYLKLLKIKDKEIELSDLVNIIKTTVKSQNYTEKTLLVYAHTFIGWLKYAGLDIPNINPKIKRSIENSITFTPQNDPQEIINFFDTITDNQIYFNDNKILKLLYDLKSLGFLTYEKNRIKLYSAGIEAKKNRNKLYSLLIESALKTDKIKYSYKIFEKYPNVLRNNFIKYISEKLDGINSIDYALKTSRILYDWAKFIYKHKS